MGFKAKLFEIVAYPESFDIAKVEKVSKEYAVRDYAYILHDKDDKKEHYHIALRMHNTNDSDYIANWFGLNPNAVSRVKGKWSDMLRYLTHENAPDKHQYDEDNVMSNFDWKKEKISNKGNNRLSEIINEIADGVIRGYNYYDKISIDEYTRWKRQIDAAFKYRTDRIKGVTRIMDCIFITGASGTGKTTYAKEIAERQNYSVFVSSGSNDVLDDYAGQDCVILDDLRPSCVGLSDLLKMLDNNTASTVKSRYRNKVLECKMIIITTTLNIDSFFRNVFKDDIESCTQLKRRCETHIEMDIEDICIRVWQKASQRYGKGFCIENHIAKKYLTSDMDQDEQISFLKRILKEDSLDDVIIKDGDFEELDGQEKLPF